MSGFLILTSTGFSTAGIRSAFQNIVKERGYRSVAIVTTASPDKAANPYAKLAETQLVSLGFTTVNFIDLEETPTADFSPYDVIYVCGGNTFSLLAHARTAHFESSVRNLLERGGCYVGVSAGSILLSPTIQIAAEIVPDNNEVALQDLTALNLVPFQIAVHYTPDQEAAVLAFEKRYETKVTRLNDEQALVIQTDTLAVQHIN